MDVGPSSGQNSASHGPHDSIRHPLPKAGIPALERDPQLLQQRRHVDVIRAIRGGPGVGYGPLLTAFPKVILAQARSPAGLGDFLEDFHLGCFHFCSAHVRSPPAYPR